MKSKLLKAALSLAASLFFTNTLTINLPAFSQQNLPPVNLDSFIKEAGIHADDIYGDEGKIDLPPFAGYTKAHRINAGIMDLRDAGLTTGHGSWMPDASGADEFIGNEWGQAGYRGHTSDSGFQNDGVAPVMNPNATPPNGLTQYGSTLGVPAPPGPGFQPLYNHGVFYGYLTPREAALWNAGYFAEAYKSFAKSDRNIRHNTAVDRYLVEREMGGTW